MAISLGKFAPTVVVVAAVSYCAWPYVFPSSGDAGGAQIAAMPEIPPSQLLPTISPPPTRDPFHLAGASADRPKDKKQIAPATTAAAAAASKSAAATHGKGEAPADPFSDLALIATSILDKQRLAVINGRIYAEREQLKSKDPAAPPCVVARILPDRVLLECAGRTATLSYASAAAPPKAGKSNGIANPSSRSAPPRPQPVPSVNHRRSREQPPL
jgi:hypothetical protein